MVTTGKIPKETSCTKHDKTTPLMFVERVKDSAVTFINIQRSAKLKIKLTFNKQ